MNKKIIFSIGILIFFISSITLYYTLNKIFINNSNIILEINKEPLLIDTKIQQVYLLPVTLNTKYETQIVNKTKDKNVKIFINENELNDKLSIKLNDLSKNNDLKLKIIRGKTERDYIIKTLPNSLSSVKLLGKSDIPGDYYGDYLAYNKNSYIYKINNDGKITYYYGKNYKLAGGVMNFNKHKFDGKTYYSFFEPEAKHKTDNPAVNYGYIVILNEKYEKIEKIGLKKSNKLPSGGLAENHVFKYLGKEHYIISGSVNRKIKLHNNKKAKVKAAYFQEVKDGKVVFEWDSTDFPSLLIDSILGNDYDDLSQYADYTHINSVNIAPDNNFVISLRHTDSVIKVSSKTGNIMWKLGGKSDDFSLTEEQKFSHQHDAHYAPNGDLLIFDNGNAKKQTRILRFKLDEKTKTVKQFSSFEIKNKYSEACGTVQQIDDDLYIIGWGYKSDNVVLSEVNFKTGKISAEILSHPKHNTYRIIKAK